jgi:GAF domain-containing protein
MVAVAERPAGTGMAGPSVGVTDRRGAIGGAQLGARVRSAFGLARTIASPLRAQDRVIGAIVLSRRGREPWPSSAERLLEAAAAEASAALERAYTFRQAPMSRSWSVS